MFNFLSRVFGSANDRVVKRLASTIQGINELEPKLAAMSDAELQARTKDFQQLIANGTSVNDLLVPAFATVREAAKRTLGMRHFDVQLIGGIVLHEGKISEMLTGEGKTLVATLPVYLNALTGKGVHVVTVNDYLATRDAEWMGTIYKFLGLSVGCIVPNMNDKARQEAYACDITYGTNNEFGFDYLRDNMKFRTEYMVQRPFNYAIVDEVDSILIDEARTPLIISGPAEDSSELYIKADRIIPRLAKDDYELDEKQKNVTLTDKGQETVEALLKEYGMLNEGGLYDIQNINLVHHVNQSLRAYKLFQKDKDYIVKDNKVIIIDEFTGRMMDGRRYSEGLHQALEAKERVAIQVENQTLASITFQNYFRMYPKLAGMTGTAQTEAAEFEEIYGLQVVSIPPNVSVARKDHQDEIYKTEAEKLEAIVKLIDDCQKRGQPVLVGTVSIEKSEQIASFLKKRKIPHNVLNARYHEQEAYIISQAGRPGAITIATNMAGRGTDIKLGGNADMMADLELAEVVDGKDRDAAVAKIRATVEADKVKVIEAGGLYVIGTERHESRRIDNQLRGRSGRQGDPGASKFFLSLDDDLMRIFASDKLQGFIGRLGLPEGEPISHPWVSKALEKAQQKVEARNFDIRKQLLKFDDVMNEQRKVIYGQRKEVIAAMEVSDIIQDMRQTTINNIVARAIPHGSFPEQWNLDGLHEEALRLLALDVPSKEWAKEDGVTAEDVLKRLQTLSNDHQRKKEKQFTPEVVRIAEKTILLQMLDQHWKDHLLSLDHLRQGISLRAYAQKDPLNEYKMEAFGMFQGMIERLRETVTHLTSHVEPRILDEDALEPKKRKTVESRIDPADKTNAPPQRQETVMKRKSAVGIPITIDPNNPATWGRVPRNGICPCGSGKKYKHCHGKEG